MPPVLERLSASRRSPRQSEIDGTRTTRTTASTAIASAATNMVASNVALSAHAPMGRDWARIRKPATASPAPISPAPSPSSSDSMTTCWTSRRRFAPSAARTAISVARPSIWPSMSAATLAHAMRRMSAMATKVASSAGRMEPSKASRIGVTTGLRVRSHCSEYLNRSPSIPVMRCSGASSA
jgi:hypothetical protein